LPKCLSETGDIGGRIAPQNANAGNLTGLLSVGSKRRENTECENDGEPDPPHVHLVGMAGGSLTDDG
jgi:hypothetical protein